MRGRGFNKAAVFRLKWVETGAELKAMNKLKRFFFSPTCNKCRASKRLLRPRCVGRRRAEMFRGTNCWLYTTSPRESCPAPPSRPPPSPGAGDKPLLADLLGPRRLCFWGGQYLGEKGPYFPHFYSFKSLFSSPNRAAGARRIELSQTAFLFN